jgi:hypothetical protein
MHSARLRAKSPGRSETDRSGWSSLRRPMPRSRPKQICPQMSGAASALITRGGDLRDLQGVREYGSVASFLLFETSGAVRKLRRLEAYRRSLRNPKNSRLAYLPSSHPPCEISGTRHVSSASAWPRELALAVAGQQRCLETTRKLLRFQLQRGSPTEEVTNQPFAGPSKSEIQVQVACAISGAL